VFPETFRAPPLVPEAVDEEAPAEVSAEQVMSEAAVEVGSAFSEHFVMLKELATRRSQGPTPDMAA
jgi:hypothetical protein